MNLYSPVSVTFDGQLFFFDTKQEGIDAYQDVVTGNTNHGGGPVSFRGRSQGAFSRVVWTPGVPITFHGEWSGE